MLEPTQRPNPQLLRSIEDELHNIGDSVWELGPLDSLLKSWVNSISANGSYSSTIDR